MTSPDPYELRRVDDSHWRIVNHVFAPGEAGFIVASLHEADDCMVAVDWVQPIALQTCYSTAFEALDDLIRWSEQRRGSERPMPIAHFPPTGPTVVPGHRAARASAGR